MHMEMLKYLFKFQFETTIFLRALNHKSLQYYRMYQDELKNIFAK